MEVAEIAACLMEYDRANPLSYLEAEIPKHRGGGGTDAWDFRASDGNWYVVKSPGNQQDANARIQAPNHPWKVLTTELVCGRLGQLFTPAICPPVAVVTVPDALAAQCISPNTGQQICGGPSFGSRVADSVMDGKQGGPLNLIPADQAARLTVFHTWLRAEDPAALVSQDGGTVWSIDHGWFLTGASWNDTTLSDTGPEEPRMLLSSWRTAYFTDAQLFRGVLDELMALSADEIVRQFAGIPSEWGATYEFMAKLAAFVLARRQSTEESTRRCWRGVA